MSGRMTDLTIVLVRQAGEAGNLYGSVSARDVADAVTEETGAPRFVAGVLGPTSRTASLSPDVNDPGYRNIDFQTLG